LKRQPALKPVGRPLPAKPLNVFAEDFSLLVRSIRLRIKRGCIRVLH
jgi:hypothetical protein